MKFDIVLAGVGGQGVLAVANLVAAAARADGCIVKQSEVHGMSQRGGAVTAHVRLSTAPIESELVPLASASMLLALEPVECLRYTEYLAPSGIVITAADPLRDIPNYPPMDEILANLRNLPRLVLVDAWELARQAGLPRATNMVVAGAASPYLPIHAVALESSIREMFVRKGARVMEQNLAAFRAGQELSCTTIR